MALLQKQSRCCIFAMQLALAGRTYSFGRNVSISSVSFTCKLNREICIQIRNTEITINSNSKRRRRRKKKRQRSWTEFFFIGAHFEICVFRFACTANSHRHTFRAVGMPSHSDSSWVFNCRSNEKCEAHIIGRVVIVANCEMLSKRLRIASGQLRCLHLFLLVALVSIRMQCRLAANRVAHTDRK